MYIKKPFNGQTTPEALLEYIERELETISRESGETQALDLRPVHALPIRPREGMIIYADGVDLDLGIGAGAYVYSSGFWVPLNVGVLAQNIQSAAYTLVASDIGKQILHPSADTTARTFTIPANSSVPFPIGTHIEFVNQNLAGTLTIAITTDTMRLAGAGTTGSRTLAANGIAIAVKLTATEWLIHGTGLT